MKNFFLFVFLMAGFSCFSQANICVKIAHRLKAQSFTVTKWRYYISHVQMKQINGWQNVNDIFLIDAFAADSFCFSVPEGRYLGIDFSIGIDSSTNARGLGEGPLDPLNAMYWTWNTGYINWKLEAAIKLGDSLQHITHHIGGFRNGENALQGLHFAFNTPAIFERKKNYRILLEANPENYFSSSKTKPTVIEPGANALQMAALFPGIFTLRYVTQQ